MHRGPFIFNEISIIFSRSRSRSGYRGRAERSRTNFGRSWTLRDRALGSRFEIIEETSPIKRQGGTTPARFPSTIPSRRVAKLCSGLQSTATYRKYSLSSPPFSRSSHSNRIEINFCSYWWKLLTRRGSAPLDFSSSTNDREKGRAAVDRRSRLPRVERRCSSTPLANGRDERERIIEHRWATAVSGVTILLSLTVFLNLVAETLPQVSDAIPLLGTTEFLHRANVRVNQLYSLQRPQFIQVSRMIFWWTEIVKVWLDLWGRLSVLIFKEASFFPTFFSREILTHLKLNSD